VTQRSLDGCLSRSFDSRLLSDPTKTLPANVGLNQIWLSLHFIIQLPSRYTSKAVLNQLATIVHVGVAAAKRGEEEQSNDYQVLDFHITTISYPYQFNPKVRRRRQ
jgi:hypothetical protein